MMCIDYRAVEQQTSERQQRGVDVLTERCKAVQRDSIGRDGLALVLMVWADLVMVG